MADLTKTMALALLHAHYEPGVDDGDMLETEDGRIALEVAQIMTRALWLTPEDDEVVYRGAVKSVATYYADDADGVTRESARVFVYTWPGPCLAVRYRGGRERRLPLRDLLELVPEMEDGGTL